MGCRVWVYIMLLIDKLQNFVEGDIQEDIVSGGLGLHNMVVDQQEVVELGVEATPVTQNVINRCYLEVDGCSISNNCEGPLEDSVAVQNSAPSVSYATDCFDPISTLEFKI